MQLVLHDVPRPLWWGLEPHTTEAEKPCCGQEMTRCLGGLCYGVGGDWVLSWGLMGMLQCCLGMFAHRPSAVGKCPAPSPQQSTLLRKGLPSQRFCSTRDLITASLSWLWFFVCFFGLKMESFQFFEHYLWPLIVFQGNFLSDLKWDFSIKLKDWHQKLISVIWSL